MALWFTLLGADLFVAGLLVGLGWLTTRSTPAYRPGRVQWFGYRTPMSQKNADTWQFANRYFSRKALTVGLVAVPFAVIAMLPALPAFGRSESFVNSWGLVVSVTLVVAPLALVLMTERALRATFTRQGARKSGRHKPATATRQTTRRTTRRTRG